MGSNEFDNGDVVFAEGAGDVRVTLQGIMSSGFFKRTYREGMDLVEEASAYLDGPGREASRSLSREGSLAYASESMRMTTRLMQVAAWLLVRKAAHAGELTLEESRDAKYRLASRDIMPLKRHAHAKTLPIQLLDLIERSEELYARVERLDKRLRLQCDNIEESHPLNDQWNRVEAFFHEMLARH